MASAKNHDKPIGNIKRVDVGDEINPDPAMYPLKSGKLVVFPDVFDLPIEEAEHFLDQLAIAESNGKITPVLKKWLSEEDYKALLEEYPTIRKLRPVFNGVMNYYYSIWGNPGEEDASES